jgi:hypothetical protein
MLFIRVTHWSAVFMLTALVATSHVRLGAEDFYSLASVQRVALRDHWAVRLTANGPVAFARLADADAPAGAQRIRIRLYGVNDSTAALGAIEGASVQATPDSHGNLDVLVTATVALDPSRPFELRAGRGPNEVDVVLRTAP